MSNKKPQPNLKEQRRILESQLANKQNKKKFALLKQQLAKLTILEKEERELRKKEAEQKKKEKDIQQKKKIEDSEQKSEPASKANDESDFKLICKFFIEAKDKQSFKCPDPYCKDIHKLDEEETLEDRIEKELLNAKDGEKVTEESFKKWLKKKEKEDKIHEKKKDAISNGFELFMLNPEIFKDDDEAYDELTDDEDSE